MLAYGTLMMTQFHIPAGLEPISGWLHPPLIALVSIRTTKFLMHVIWHACDNDAGACYVEHHCMVERFYRLIEICSENYLKLVQFWLQNIRIYEKRVRFFSAEIS